MGAARTLALITGLLLLAGGAHAQGAGAPASAPEPVGDPAAGKSKAFACVGCHGVNGIGNHPLWPNLAGQKEAYMVKQLRAFKDGVRQDPLMTPPAQALGEQDMADLAAWYASLPCPTRSGE